MPAMNIRIHSKKSQYLLEFQPQKYTSCNPSVRISAPQSNKPIYLFLERVVWSLASGGGEQTTRPDTKQVRIDQYGNGTPHTNRMQYSSTHLQRRTKARRIWDMATNERAYIYYKV